MKSDTTIDGEAAVKALKSQRETALDCWAQAEGRIAFLMSVIEQQRTKILELETQLSGAMLRLDS